MRTIPSGSLSHVHGSIPKKPSALLARLVAFGLKMTRKTVEVATLGAMYGMK